MSALDRTPQQMREDATMWARAGCPSTFVGRYRDAADQIQRLQRELAATASDVIRAEGRLARIASELRAAGNPLADIYFHETPPAPTCAYPGCHGEHETSVHDALQQETPP